MRNRIPLIMAFLCTVALGASVTQNVSLNKFAGEFSPLMNARFDFPKYAEGAKTLENMLVRSQGPITRRPGTKYIASVKDDTDTIRIIPFEISTDLAYIIELGDAYVRFYKDGEQVVTTYSAWTTTTAYVIGNLVTNTNYYRCLVAHTSGTFATDLAADYWVETSGATDLAYEIVTPWDSNDIFDLQYALTGNTMRLAHGDYEPQLLVRSADTSWSCTGISSTSGPFLDENIDPAWTLTADGTTGSVSIVSTDPLFDDDEHVGALFRMRHLLESTTVSGEVGNEETENSSNLTVQKYRFVDFTTKGEWYGDIEVQRSYDGGSNWAVIFPCSSSGNANFSTTFQELEDDALYRVHVELADGVEVALEVFGIDLLFTINYLEYRLTARSFWMPGVVEITDVTDTTNVTATVLYDLGSTDATYRWSEGAWSDYRGWPKTIEYHELRAVYGGSESYPNNIWASIIATQQDGYDDFTDHTEADFTGLLGGPDNIAWTYLIAGNFNIQWLKSREYLMVGTTMGVGRLGQPGKPITPNFVPTFRMQAMNGAAYMQPVAAANSVLYVEKGSQKIRELTYTFASERYVAPDMTTLAEHITGDGITQIGFQERPEPTLWCIREDGELLSFTYNRQYDNLSWSRNTTGTSDEFASIAIISGTDEDQAWVVADRAVDTYIEQFQPLDWGTDQNDCYFVDSGTDDITDLAHLEGETVALWADGRPIGTYTVASGEITPSGSYTDTTVGLPYTSVFETMPLIVETEIGRLNSYRATIKTLSIDFQETLGCSIGPDSSDNRAFLFSDDSFATTIDTYTGYKDAPYLWGSTREPTIYFTESGPGPLTIRGIKSKIEFYYDD